MAPTVRDIDTANAPADPVTTLLVDADRSFAQFAREELNHGGGQPIRLLHASTLSEADAVLAAAPVDVILLSQELPDGDGFAWLRTVSSSIHAGVVVVGDGLPEGSPVPAGTGDVLVKNHLDGDRLAEAIRCAAEHERARQLILGGRDDFQALIEHARDLITVVDEVGRILYQSPSALALLGTPPDRHRGGSFPELVHPEDAARARMLIEQVCSGEVTPRTEVRLPHADGSLRTFEVIASAMAPSGEGRRAVLNARDITERRHAEDALRIREEQLRQAQKMEAVGRLAGGIAHDFSNVLTVITGACDRLQETIARGLADTRQVDVILRNCGRATALTRQLLAFSRQQTVAPQIVDVRALITGASDLLADLVGSHVQVDVDVEPELSPIEIDPVQLEQVLMNLAINAGDAMADGGHLRFIGRNVTVLQGGPTLLRPPVAPGEYVRLEVIDTGHGMTADTRTRAFEPFFTTKTPDRGTGLGLATVYGIVTQSRGHISIDSAPGKGTRFEMYFPARSGHVPPAVPLASAASRTEPAQKATILVAEDDPDVRSLLCDTLIAKGYTVVEAGGVGEATRAASQHAGSIDLLLTDLVMPGGSGRELARQIAISKPRLRVLYMSGFGDAARQGCALLEPGDPFLAKPFTSRQLLDAVSALLG